VKRTVFVLLALGMVLVARADEKPPRLSVGSLPAAQTLSVKDVKESDGWFEGQIKKVESKAYNFIGWCYENGKMVAKNKEKAFTWYTKSAELGDADGQSNLGSCYSNGKGVAKDDKESFKWFKRSADQGNGRGKNGIGWCYEKGIVVTKNEKVAFTWYSKSAEQGSPYGQRNLGRCYEFGIGTAKDEKEAVKLYTKSAERGYARGQNNLGCCYESGIGVVKDTKEAVKWYTKAAEQGDAYGQINLGRSYESGRGIAKDEKEAVKWYAKAVEEGNGRAQSFLGWCYENGIGVEKDIKEAVRLYTKSAEQGDSLGQNNLGACYAKGNGVEKDEKVAFNWYSKSAEQKDDLGQRNLGYCYEYGQGVVKDEKEAVKWYTKSAEQRNAVGQNSLGRCYANGKGVEKDEKEAFKWYTKAAEQGDAYGQSNLGRCYEEGKGVAKDVKEAVKWYTMSAEQGNADGMINLAWCCSSGIGLLKDEAEALKWYRKAADLGNGYGYDNLGRCYETGRGVAKDEKEAVKWYTKAAEQGNSGGQNNLGRCYETGKVVAKDEKEAVKWFTKSAEQDNADGQNNLGRCYQIGKGVAKDEKEAVKWYTKAAEQGQAYAQSYLGQCYENGTGVAKDAKEAVKWYTKSAEQGNVNGQSKLGWCYDSGTGVTKDGKEAVKWYAKAAEQGDSSSQNNLGTFFRDGTGVSKDEKEALKWYTKAAEQGDANGEVNLGWCYETGKGVAKDEKEAVKWYTKSAEHGNAYGQNNLGLCYENGKGVEKDLKEAAKWYIKAAEQGNRHAQKNLGDCYANGMGVTKNEEEALRWNREAALQKNTAIKNTLSSEEEEKQELGEKPYFELSRDEMNQIESQCETLSMNKNDLVEAAKQSASKRKIDKCLSILKYKNGGLCPAVIETCNLWLQDHKNPKEKEILRKWIKGLQKKYPEEIYPLYVEAVEQLFEDQREDACSNINKIKTICEAINNEPQERETQEVERKRQNIMYRGYSGILSELLLYVFAIGEPTKVFTLFKIVGKLGAKTNDKTYQDTTRQAQKVFDNLQCLYLQQYDRPLQVIQNKQADLKEVLSAADSLLPVKAEVVCKELRERMSKSVLKADEKIEIAKLFWRNGNTSEYEDIILPLLKASNQEASIWFNEVKKLKKGVPDDVSQSSIVRLAFPLGQGTGFFITQDGVIATAAHNFAVSKENPFAVQIFDYKNTKLTASKIYIDPTHDLALVQVEERPESNLSIYEGEMKTRTIVNTIGFPKSSTQCYFQPVEVVASYQKSSDILLSGESMRGMSGGPITFSNQVIGVTSSSLSATKGNLLKEGIHQLHILKVNETNSGSKELDNNVMFQPETIWCNYFSESLAMNDAETSMPPLYKTPRTFTEYCKTKNKQFIENRMEGANTTYSMLKNDLGDSDPIKPERKEALSKENIQPELVKYIEAHKEKTTRAQKLEEILKDNPNFSPALKELAFFSLLGAVGKKDEYEALLDKKEKGSFQVYFKNIQDPEAFNKSLELMKRYWNTDPNLRWDFLPRIAGCDETMKMYFTLKKMGPLLIAQQDGSLSNDQLKGFAKEGNTLAMAYLAERLISGKEALSGYMFALQAAESGEPKGQSILAFYLLSGTAAAKNVKRGFDWALKSAEAGDPRGSTLAGVCFIQGIGTVPDKTKGMELLKIGIKGGDPTALQIAKNPGLETQIQFLPLSSGNNSQ